MLTNKLNEAINILDSLIEITKQDIENIKKANHQKIFNNMKPKEELAKHFSNTKNDINLILRQRNKPIEEIFSIEEEKLFEEFKKKLIEFNALHKKFSKLAISVANFYNALTQQIKEEKTISYNNHSFKNNILSLKA